MGRRQQRILVVARGHLGDLVGALPALRSLRAAYPEAHISVLVNEYVCGALDGCPFVDEVIYGFTYTRRGRLGRLAHTGRLLLRLAGRYDTVVALRHSPKITPLLAVLSGARTRVGYDQPGRLARLWTHNIGPQPTGISNRLRNLRPVAALGAATDPAYPRLDWLGADVRAATSALLAEHGLDDGVPFAVLQVSCNWGCNEWRSDKWAALGDYLFERHGLRSVVTGTDDPFERAKFEEVRQLMQHPPISLHGRTSIAQLFDVVGRARLVVATDSALTQVALAQRTPSVILFGIEPMAENGPLPDEIGVTIMPIQHWEGPGRAPTPNPHCRFGESYCHTSNCCENSSLRQTSVAEVQTQVERLLGVTTLPMLNPGCRCAA